MPIEIRRFGAGTRRAGGPPGTVGVSGRVIHSDARGVISELAFAPGGRVPLHDNANTSAWFLVIEGGGWVQVGDERRRVGAGEAVVWPAGVGHGAWTEGTPMRVIIVELAGADDAWARGILEGLARRIGPGERGQVSKGEGRLAPRTRAPRRDGSTGEPD
jgi:quercetin dioxygenase-like cupin family protein